MPSLMKMLNAMHSHNRAVALEHGKEAVELLPALALWTVRNPALSDK